MLSSSLPSPTGRLKGAARRGKTWSDASGHDRPTPPGTAGACCLFWNHYGNHPVLPWYTGAEGTVYGCLDIAYYCSLLTADAASKLPRCILAISLETPRYRPEIVSRVRRETSLFIALGIALACPGPQHDLWNLKVSFTP